MRVRALREDDWRALREMRLHALRTEPGVFASSFAAESERPDDDWRALARNDDASRQIFGLFDGDALIGITGIVTWRDDPSGTTALLVMSYIDPAYRGRGLSRLLYEARLAWARASGRFTRVRVSHRRSNAPSARANRRFGFVEVGAVDMTWPDGEREDEVSYELSLTEPI